MEFPVYLESKTKPRYGKNVSTSRGHIWLGGEIEFEVVSFAYDPQLPKNINVRITENGKKLLKKNFELNDKDIENIESAVQMKILNREVIEVE